MLPARGVPHWSWAALAGVGALSGAALYRHFNRSAVTPNGSDPTRVHIVSETGTWITVESFDEATQVMKSLREIAALPEARWSDRPGRRYEPT